MAETFSGEGEYLHVNTNPAEFKVQSKRPVYGYGDTALGEALYMSDKTDRKWFSPEGMGMHMTTESGPVQSVHLIKTKFKNALVITPENLWETLDETRPEGQAPIGFRQWLRDNDFDGVIVKGFDELSDADFDELMLTVEEHPRASLAQSLTQDQVVNLKPEQTVVSTKAINPRDYNKALMTAAEEKSYLRNQAKEAGAKELYYIDPATRREFSLDELADEDFVEWSGVDKNKLKPTMVDTNYTTKSPYRAKMRSMSNALRKVGPEVGKILGFAGLPLLFTQAQDTYANEREGGASKLGAATGAGVQLAKELLLPMGLESPEVGAGSDIPISDEYYKDPVFEDLYKTGLESSIK